jgi:probable rRNA maturation factor
VSEVIDVEVFGASAGGEEPNGGPRLARGVPPIREIERLCTVAANSAGVRDGHLAIEFVDAERIAELNARYRGEQRPTDVLSFPIDGPDAALHERSGVDGSTRDGERVRELGDVVICVAHTTDVREAVVHGVLHLMGMDHETDDGEMLALQRAVLARARA